MNPRPLFLSLPLLCALIFQVSSAWPCSLAPRPDAPVLTGTVGPNPLLISTNATAALFDSTGTQLTLGAIPAPPALTGAKDPIGGPLFFFQLAAPLTDGDYSLDGVPFSVSSSASEDAPSLGTRGNLELFLSNPDDGNECGDTSGLLVDLLDVRADELEHARFLINFEAPDGTRFRRLVSLHNRFESTVRLRFYVAFVETGHVGETPLCVQASPVSSSGVVGATLDLGCVDPTSDSDPRVFRSQSSGCAVSNRGPGLSALWLLLGFFAILRARRQR